MRKKLLALVVFGAAVVGTMSLASDIKGGNVCPKGMRMVRCPYGVICCDPPPAKNTDCSCY